MKIEFAQHVLDELSLQHADVIAGASNMMYGTYSERHPYAGKMIRCPHCRTRRRANATLPCCSTKESGFTPSVGSPAHLTDRQIIGSDKFKTAFSGARRNPHGSQKKRVITELRKLLEESNAARNQIVQFVDCYGKPPKEVSKRIGKTTAADAANLANAYFTILWNEKRKAAQKRHRSARRVNFGLLATARATYTAA